MREAVAVRAAGVWGLWLAVGFAAGAVGIAAAYRFGPMVAVAFPAAALYLYWAHQDLRAGLFGLLMAMGVGESVGFDLGLFTLSPFKVALAVILALALVRELMTRSFRGTSLAQTGLSSVEIASVFFGLALVASSVAASDHMSVIKETIVTAMAIALFMVTRRVLRRISDVRQMFWGIAAFGSIIGVQAVAAYLQGQRTVDELANSGDLRVGSVLGHPNQLAGLLVLVLPIAFVLLVQERRLPARIVAATFSAVIALALLFTLSRTGWVAGIAGLLVVALLVRGRLLLWVFLLVAVLAMLVGFIGASGALETRAQSAADLGQYEVASRFGFWSAAFHMVEASPIVGVGLANYSEAYADLNFQGKWYLPGPGNRPPPHAHNLALTLLAETGVLGIMAFLGLVGVLVATLARAHRLADSQTRLLVAGLAGALVAYGVDNLADMTFFNNLAQTTFWMELGCLGALVDILAGRRASGCMRE